MDYAAQTKLSFFFLLLSVLIVQLRAATPPPTPKPSTPSNPAGPLVFKSPLARQFMVPERLPGVTFPIQQSYAGRLSASSNPKISANLFFWFVPADNSQGSQDLTIWANGDGCTGLIGAFQGNGPITIRAKGLTKNPNSWTRSSSMLYLDIPLNVGFSNGQAPQRGSADIAGFVFNFLTNFLKVFPEMAGRNLYMAGHGYAGTFISHAADKIYAQQSSLALKLQGILLSNAFISTPEFQQHIPAASFVAKNNDVFKIDPAGMKELLTNDKVCGLSDYLAQHLKYPPPGPFPPVAKAVDPAYSPAFRERCMLYMMMYQMTSPELDLWNIHDKPGSQNSNYTNFFYPGRPDVQKAFNVAGAPHWAVCKDIGAIFPNGDASPPATKVLPNLIQRSKRVVIAHGALDGSLPIAGLKLAIQGMTWGGKQGFQQPKSSDFVVGGKPSGKYQTERGLTFVEVAQGGSLIPHDQGQTALAIFEYLLGRRPSP